MNVLNFTSILAVKNLNAQLQWRRVLILKGEADKIGPTKCSTVLSPTE